MGYGFQPHFNVCEVSKEEYEECPATVWGGTPLKSEKIFFHQLVVKPSEDRNQSVSGRIPAYIVRSCSATQVIQDFVHRKIDTGSTEITSLVTLERDSEQSIQSMYLLKCPLIFQCIIPKGTYRFATSPYSFTGIIVIIITFL